MSNGFKAFNKDMTCKGKQYEVGKFYEEKEAEICKKGMHFCKDPFDVLNYYNIAESEFCTVESDGEEKTHNEDSKIATTKLKITAKIGLPGFIRACIDFVLEKTKAKNELGNSARICSSGNSAKIGSSGHFAKIDSTGKNSVISAIGYNCFAKGKIGSWIVLAEWVNNVPILVKSVKIDGKKIKEDMWYKLKDKKIIKA